MNCQECNHCIVPSGDSQIVDNLLSLLATWVFLSFFRLFVKGQLGTALGGKDVTAQLGFEAISGSKSVFEAEKEEKSKFSLLVCCHLASGINCRIINVNQFRKGLPQ